MNVKQELELLYTREKEIFEEKNLIFLVDIFQKVKLFNQKIDIDSTTLTVFNSTSLSVYLKAEKEGLKINKHITGVFKSYGIGAVVMECFLNVLPEKKDRTDIIIDNKITLDEFMNKYISSEYNSRYLYKKMISGIDNTEEKITKKPKI